jgi:hypothetical protein
MNQGQQVVLGEVDEGPEDRQTTSLGLVNHGRSYLCAAKILLPYTDAILRAKPSPRLVMLQLRQATISPRVVFVPPPNRLIATKELIID